MLILLKSSKWTLDRFKDNGGIFFLLLITLHRESDPREVFLTTIKM